MQAQRQLQMQQHPMKAKSSTSTAGMKSSSARLEDHYPGYTIVDGTTGTIGDVTVKWNITPSDDNAYQNNLDATLIKAGRCSS